MRNKFIMKAAIAAATSLLAHAAMAAQTVEKCTTMLGTISVVDSRQGYGYLSSYSLGSPSALLRMMIQESGCFDVVERGGAAFDSIQRERALAGDGDLQQNSNLGKGQLQAADFVLTSNIQVSAGDTGGVGGILAGLGGLFGKAGAVVGMLAGGLKFKEAETSILVADVRSGIQVASAEGKAKKTDFSMSAWGFGGGNLGAAGGYTKTPEGKMIATSLLDNYNNIVLKIRDKPQLIKPRNAASVANAAASVQATNQFAAMPVAQTGAVAQQPSAPRPVIKQTLRGFAPITTEQQDIIKTALYKIMTNEKIRVMVKEAEPNVLGLIERLSCLNDVERSTPLNEFGVGSALGSQYFYGSFPIRTTKYHDKSMCMKVLRITGWASPANNAFSFSVMYQAEDSGETDQTTHEVIRQTDGSWLFAR